LIDADDKCRNRFPNGKAAVIAEVQHARNGCWLGMTAAFEGALRYMPAMSCTRISINIATHSNNVPMPAWPNSALAPDDQRMQNPAPPAPSQTCVACGKKRRRIR